MFFEPYAIKNKLTDTIRSDFICMLEIDQKIQGPGQK